MHCQIRSFHPLLHRPSAWSGHPRVLSCCLFQHAPGKEQGPKTFHQQFMEKYLKSLWGYSGVLGGCIICSVGTLEFFFETKSKVGSTRLWNTALNLNQQAIQGFLSQLALVVALQAEGTCLMGRRSKWNDTNCYLLFSRNLLHRKLTYPRKIKWLEAEMSF